MQNLVKDVFLISKYMYVCTCKLYEHVQEIMKTMFLPKYYKTTCAFRTPHVCLAEMTHSTHDITVIFLLHSACHGRFLTNYIWIYINTDVECVLTECCKHLFKLFSFPALFIEVVSDLTIEINQFHIKHYVVTTYIKLHGKCPNPYHFLIHIFPHSD